MRTRACLGLLLLVAAMAAGCDSDTPLQVGEQQLALTVSSVGARINEFFRVWVLFEDTDADGTPDDIDGDGTPDLTYWCDANTPPNLAVTSVPFRFRIEMEILRAGETEPFPLTSVQSLTPASNRALYDTSVQTSLSSKAPRQITHADYVCDGNNSISCDPASPTAFCASFDAGACTVERSPGTVTRTFLFRNPTDGGVSARASVLSALNRLVLQSTSHLISNLTNDSTGICPGSDPGDPMVDNLPQPFPFSLKKGDTVIVRLGRVDDVFPGVTFDSEPEISASLTLEGSPVNVEGSSTTNGAENAVTFNFTSR